MHPVMEAISAANPIHHHASNVPAALWPMPDERQPICIPRGGSARSAT